MKWKIFILSGFVLLVQSASAQFRLGARGGMNISNVRINDYEIQVDDKTGFQAGICAELMFHLPVGVEAAVLYSQKGLKVEDVFGITHTTKTEYLDVPVNLKFRVGPRMFRFYAAAGPYISFRISGDQSINGIYNQVNEQWRARDFQAGVNIGGGIELFEFLQLGANYGIGLTDDYSSGNYEAKDRTWSITATLYF